MALKVPPTQTSLEFCEPPSQGLSPHGHLPSAAGVAEDAQSTQILWLIVAPQEPAVAGLSCKPQMLFALPFASFPLESSAAVLSNSYHS